MPGRLPQWFVTVNSKEITKRRSKKKRSQWRSEARAIQTSRICELLQSSVAYIRQQSVTFIRLRYNITNTCIRNSFTFDCSSAIMFCFRSYLLRFFVFDRATLRSHSIIRKIIFRCLWRLCSVSMAFPGYLHVWFLCPRHSSNGGKGI